MIIQNESYELYQPPNKDTKLFITCEHATNMYVSESAFNITKSKKLLDFLYHGKRYLL